MTSALSPIRKFAGRDRRVGAAIVLDAHLKSALCVIRSLGARGIPVVAGAERKTAMGFYSRWTAQGFLYPAPMMKREEFVRAVREAARKWPAPPVVYTFSDSTFLPLFHEWDRFRGCASAVLPGPGSVEIAFDKLKTATLAWSLGIETPRTESPRDLDEMGCSAARLGFPVVVKPRCTANWRGDTGNIGTAVFAHSAGDARRECAAMVQAHGEMPLLQECIRGEELGIEFLCRAGEVLAVCAHRRIRSLSPAGGSAVVKQTIPETYGRIGEYGRRIMAALHWTGPAMVEFKVDERDGRAKLLEINGRFWGSLPLAVAAGVDFPYLYYRVARGEHVAVPAYREGVVSRHWLGDMAHLAAVLFGRNSMRPLLYPSRLAALRHFVFSGKSRPDVASRRDPVPAMMEAVDGVVRLCSRLYARG